MALQERARSILDGRWMSFSCDVHVRDNDIIIYLFQPSSSNPFFHPLRMGKSIYIYIFTCSNYLLSWLMIDPSHPPKDETYIVDSHPQGSLF